MKGLKIMKTVQKYFVFGMLMTAGLIFAGCGDTTTGDGGGTTEAPAEGSDSSADGSGTAPDNASTGGSGELQLVSLSVPNMTWAGCAVSVRDALVKVDGIDKDSIDTDTSSKVVKFQAPAGFDLDSKLAEFSDHDHLKGWSKK